MCKHCTNPVISTIRRLKWQPCNWTFSESLRLDESIMGKVSDEDCVIFYINIQKKNKNKHQHGVGIMMRKSIASYVTGYWPISDRLIILKLGG